MNEQLKRCYAKAMRCFDPQARKAMRVRLTGCCAEALRCFDAQRGKRCARG